MGLPQMFGDDSLTPSVEVLVATASPLSFCSGRLETIHTPCLAS